MIYFLRHAHRDTHDPSADNGLSEKGWEQCDDLARYFKKKVERIDEARSSPKVRCMQTTESVAKAYKLKVREDWSLHESAGDSDRDFRDRIVKLLEKLQSEKKTLLLGTHGDVLDVILRWGAQKGEIHKGDLLIWDPCDNSWILNPLRGH
ncbi:MAG: phosphoglycerate mutase family protein [Bdellovibrionota bacterium]